MNCKHIYEDYYFIHIYEDWFGVDGKGIWTGLTRLFKGAQEWEKENHYKSSYFCCIFYQINA